LKEFLTFLMRTLKRDIQFYRKGKMEKLKFLTCFLFIYFISITTANGQDSLYSGIAILPFHSNGIEPVYIETAESILQIEISKFGRMKVISTKHTKDALSDEVCVDSECALEIGKELNASQVLGVRLSALGEKIITQYFLIDVSAGKEILIDQVTATTIEELETVMKRIASSVVNVRPAGKSVEVGTILEAESEESLRRTSNKNIGLSFGYLYPQNGYDNDERSFVANLHLDYELEEYAVGMLLGIRKGFAINIYGDYLFSKTDFCPFIGGAFGFHWITHSDFYEPYYINDVYVEREAKRSDGFEITANAGMRILHTYNFQILINLEFIYTINDYDDTAIVFTIGIL
jgi:hypothetical protein